MNTSPVRLLSRLLAPALLLAALPFAPGLNAADKYTGPRPAKADVPYLIHADNLVETEATQAQEESRKDGTNVAIGGASSSARTPLPEPAFLYQAKNVAPEKIALYRLDVKNGRRELFLSRKVGKNGGPIRLSVSRLGNDLYRLEATRILENGEYCLSPDGSSQSFCFQIY